MIIEILISTIDAGINKIFEILLPFRTDVKYLVSHQYTDEKYLPIPNHLIRKDVLVSQIPGKGLTKSRNNAIRLATGDVCVIADDDVRYTNEYFNTVIDTYNNHTYEVVCFKISKSVEVNELNEDYKFYPNTALKINQLSDHSPSSIEITFRLDSVRKSKVFFDERFGLGSWLIGGEENLFIYDSINEGLNVWFVPKYIVKHPHECTITSFSKYHERRVRVTGAMDMRLHGWISFLKALPRTIILFQDLIKNKKNPIKYLCQTLEGSYYILKNKHRNL